MTALQRVRSHFVHRSVAILVAFSCVALADRAEAELVTALLRNTGTNAQGIARFDTVNTTIFTSPFVAINGTAESILGIDYRPTTQLLYGFGSIGGLYTINTGTGLATQVGALSSFPGNGNFFGFDFNPVADLAGAASLRIVNEGNSVVGSAQRGDNFAVNVNPGLIGQATPQTPIDPASASITASAYSNNDLDPATGTTLYGIDIVTDTLLTTTNPAGGIYTTVGSLGLPGNELFEASFDISGLTGDAYAAYTPGAGNSSLYRINLGTGAASLVGTIGPAGFRTEGIALLPAPAAVPEPSSMLLLGLCGAGMFGYRLRRRKAVPPATAA